MNDTDNIIDFAAVRPLDTDPDIDEMTLEQLEAYLTELKLLRNSLDSREPEDIDSEEYEAWADEHEELEDLIDEVEDCLDALRR